MKEAKDLYFAVCMDAKPAFLVHGKPNGRYTITTKPKYYVAVTEYKQGTVISAEFIAGAKEFVFDGTREKVGSLDDTLTFNFE